MNVLILALLLSPGASKDPAVKMFNQLYAKATDAYKHKDLSVFMAMTAPDFHTKLHDGQLMDRTETESVMRRQLATFKAIKEMKVQVDKVEMKGTTAVVYSSQRVTVEITDQDKVRHSIVQSSKGEDRWVKTSNGWRVQLSEEVSHKVSVDGKPSEGWDKPSAGAGN